MDMHERSLMAASATCQACAEQLQDDMEATLVSQGFSAECLSFCRLVMEDTECRWVRLERKVK